MSERKIFITEKDLERLEKVVQSIDSDYASNLESELGDATIVPPDQIPDNVVTMNSKVEFLDMLTGKTSIVTLVYPSKADSEENKISVLAPVGSALLGLCVGQEIDWPMPNGRTGRFKIVKVLYQPEAAGDFHL